MDSSPRPLEIMFLPFLAPTHMIPLFEISRLFAARSQNVTVFTIPSFASTLQTTIDKDNAASGHRISLCTIPFPSREVGLPDGVDFATPGPHDHATTNKLFAAVGLLRPKIEEFLDARRPDCIVADRLFPWAADAGVRLDVPVLVFHMYCIFGQVLHDTIIRPDSPHRNIESDNEPFVFPGLPDPITMTRSRLPMFVRTEGDPFSHFVEQWRVAEEKSYGVLVNGFYELESGYTDHYKKLTGHKIFHIGPVSLIHRSAAEKSERFQKSTAAEHECLRWLDSKAPKSVLYICFGSYCIFPDEQLMEIAAGLEVSGHQFIWVVHGRAADETAEEKSKWLPEGFEERIKERGIIIKGWAPQVLILEHESVGGFLTHCGWNSVMEGVSSGVPLITWPLYAEQFFNEKLVTQALRVGVEVGAEDWSTWVDVGKKVVKREKIEKAVRRLMDGGGDEAVEMMREKIKGLGERAKRAVEEGGSSHRNLTVLIEELKQLRDHRAIP